MRKKIVAGNWKMNNQLNEGIELGREIMRRFHPENNKLMVLCPPFIHLAPLSQLVRGTEILTGAQNCSSEIKGAFTGEISAEMILSCGASYVIIGHSERRSYYGETNAILQKKVGMALEKGLLPIYCCGETLAERNDGKLFDVIKTQLYDGIFNLNVEQLSKVVIAYEPVWAIGTGVTATSEQAQEMHHYIRKLIAEKYSYETAEQITLLYGGSCNAKNAGELFSCPDVDGGLIGGASLKAEDFVTIYNSFPK